MNRWFLKVIAIILLFEWTEQSHALFNASSKKYDYGDAESTWEECLRKIDIEVTEIAFESADADNSGELSLRELRTWLDKFKHMTTNSRSDKGKGRRILIGQEMKRNFAESEEEFMIKPRKRKVGEGPKKHMVGNCFRPADDVGEPEWDVGGVQYQHMPTICHNFKYLSKWSFPPSAIGASKLPTPEQLDAFPRFNVIGLAKAGSTSVYKMLVDAGIRKAYERKEFCANDEGGDNPDTFVTEYLQRLLARNPGGAPAVNGCICHLCVMCTHKYLSLLGYRPEKPIKYIMSVRDPADRAWATYNYFRTAMDCPHRVYYPIVSTDTHNGIMPFYRSPEMFHELMVAGRRIPLSFLSFSTVFREVPTASWVPASILRALRRLAGRSNILVLETGNINAVALASFIGVPLGKVRVQHINQNSDGDSLGIYKISGYRPILEKTRLLIYNATRRDCVEVCLLHDACLHECMGSRPS